MNMRELGAGAKRLSRGEIAFRFAALLAIGLGAFALRAIDPAAASWLPLRTSCGAITGLPCIFCGTTRALHHLLNGEFARALYFNWLAFVVVLIAIFLAGNLIAEVAFRRRLLRFPTVRITPRLAGIAGVSILALWIFQITLALSFHKHELLNSSGVLYRLLLK